MAPKTVRLLCDRIKWRVIPFAILFFVTVAVLLGVYRFRTGDKNDLDPTHSATKRGGMHKRLRSGKHGDEGPTHDRWLILSDDQETDYLCALTEVSAELGWRSLIVGRNASCCRKSCILLNNAKIKSLNYEILPYLSLNDTVSHRNVAFLYAIQHGARHIFDAYPATFVAASVPLETFSMEMHRQLLNLTLDVALGLVSERPYVKRVQNPYVHFGRPDLWTEGFRRNNQRDVQNHVYRICEVRPPSMEKFLETDTGSFDSAAPALTLPGAALAPFSSKNTLYSLEAFWGLPLLPSKEPPGIPAHLLRTLWNQAILGDIAGSMRLSLSTVPTLQRRGKTRKDPSELREPSDGFASFLLKWTCSTRSSLGCVHDLARSMFQLNYITSREAEFLDAWIADLTKLRYLEPPIIPRRRGYMNPCLGADGLYGVTFYPSLETRNMSEEQQYRRNVTLTRYLNDETLVDILRRARADGHAQKKPDSETSENPAAISEKFPVVEETELETRTSEGSDTGFNHRHGKIYESGDNHHEDHPLLKEFADSMCPGYSNLVPFRSEAVLSNVLLVIAMTSNRYDMIPMFEVIYRQHFKNILYCGSPHDSIEIFLRKYQVSESRSFSFLPAHTKYTYECLMGALEMGYNVEGYIMTSDDTLINTWNIPSLNFSKLWYGSDHNVKVTAKEWKSLDPGGQKLPRSLEGVLKVIEFLKGALIGSHEDQNAYYRPSKVSKREADPAVVEEEENPNAQKTDFSDGRRLPFVEGILQLPADSSLQLQDNKEKASNVQDRKEGHILVDLITDIAEGSILPSLKYDVVNESEVPAERTIEAASESNAFAGNSSSLLIDSSEVLAEEASKSAEDDSEEDMEDIESVDTDSERPVAEVLRKLLVATRNNTQNGTTTESPELTSTQSSETMNVDNTSTTLRSVPLEEDPIEISAKAKEIFHLEDEWDKITEHTNTSNPALELFIHTVPSPEPQPVPEPQPDLQPELVKIPDTPSIPELEYSFPNDKADTSVNQDSATAANHKEHHNESKAVNRDGATENKNSSLGPSTEKSREVNPTSEFHVILPVQESQAIQGQAEPPAIEISNQNETNSPTPAMEERSATDIHVEETLTALQNIYSIIKENLGVPTEAVPDTWDLDIYGGDRSHYRLDPKSIPHFRCEKGTGLEFCKVSSEFLYQLSENVGNLFHLYYDKVPMYYIPNKHQLKFYLLSNLMLQHGVTDEIAVPLILSGLSSEDDWIKLEKSYFGAKSTPTGVSSKYPLFVSSAAYLYPSDLNTVLRDSKIQKVFCLKYLLRILKT